jgi:hypothetical protein
VIQAAERLPLSTFAVNHKGCGDEQDPQALPKELARREKLLKNMDQACAQLEQRAKERAAAQQVDYQRKVAEREERKGSSKGSKPKPPKKITDPVLLAMAEKLKTEEGRAIYRKRACTAEPTFGIIKEGMGFRQFLLRGLKKVSGEWNLVCLAYNLKRLHTLSQAVVKG